MSFLEEMKKRRNESAHRCVTWSAMSVKHPWKKARITVHTSWPVILPETAAIQTKLTVLTTSVITREMLGTICNAMFRLQQILMSYYAACSDDVNLWKRKKNKRRNFHCELEKRCRDYLFESSFKICRTL